MEQLTTPERNKMAAIYGLLLGIISVILSTIVFSQVGGDAIVSGALGFGTGLVSLAVLAIMAIRIRKANGGYLEFREAFGAIFVMLLVSTVISFIYGFVYKTYIDPDFAMKMKTAALKSMEKMKMPDSKLDEMADKMDKDIAESKKFNLGNNFMSLASMLLLNCLFGLIVAALVKKKRPMFEQS
jgi:Na+/H+-dicarboxylate symporter